MTARGSYFTVADYWMPAFAGMTTEGTAPLCAQQQP
jgi:hypothetical protein